MRRVRKPRLIMGDIRRRLLPLIRPDTVTIRGVMVPIGAHLSPRILDSLYSGRYECVEAELLERTLEESDVVIELGAGIGFTSALCSRRIGGARVHAYEADAALEQPIRRLYGLNGFIASPRMYALGPGAGTMQLTVREEFWETSSLDSGSSAVKYQCEVPVRSFDDECAGIQPSPTYLIMDIEGGEYDFFKGVALRSIDKVMCEIHEELLGGDRVGEMRDVLVGRGFMLEEVRDGDNAIWYLQRRSGTVNDA
jgi:FkbM family methyltransferase